MLQIQKIQFWKVFEASFRKSAVTVLPLAWSFRSRKALLTCSSALNSRLSLLSQHVRRDLLRSANLDFLRDIDALHSRDFQHAPFAGRVNHALFDLGRGRAGVYENDR